MSFFGEIRCDAVVMDVKVEMMTMMAMMDDGRLLSMRRVMQWLLRHCS